MKKYISWETPPEKGKEFCLYTDKNRMIMLQCITRLDDDPQLLDKDENIIGWKRMDISNTAPPFFQIPQKINSKD